MFILLLYFSGGFRIGGDELVKQATSNLSILFDPVNGERPILFIVLVLLSGKVLIAYLHYLDSFYYFF